MVQSRMTMVPEQKNGFVAAALQCISQTCGTIVQRKLCCIALAFGPSLKTRTNVISDVCR
jgi:hypothetical protein